MAPCTISSTRIVRVEDHLCNQLCCLRTSCATNVFWSKQRYQLRHPEKYLFYRQNYSLQHHSIQKNAYFILKTRSLHSICLLNIKTATCSPSAPKQHVAHASVMWSCPSLHTRQVLQRFFWINPTIADQTATLHVSNLGKEFKSSEITRYT